MLKTITIYADKIDLTKLHQITKHVNLQGKTLKVLPIKEMPYKSKNKKP